MEVTDAVPTRPMRNRLFAKGPEPAAALVMVGSADIGAGAGGGMLLGYARVSKGDEQNNALQARALRAARCRKLFEEAVSGGRWDRPELHRMLVAH